ncbi:hypothetical protein B4135_4279 [Caldibacillus debilis]|uniref:Uncharacterized protein n=1 Tax=Caldibacillus debilis TaxID=301148 RepID=A0A150L5L8_9BACI|nr:hypothetical protein B4135_4279 [Caldibacillus debilis]
MGICQFRKGIGGFFYSRKPALRPRGRLKPMGHAGERREDPGRIL